MRLISFLTVVACGVLLVLAPGVGRAELVVKSLAIPATAANGENQDADYLYSSAVGRYVAGDGCHVAPAYLPHGGDTATVTVTEFVAYAIDDFAGNETYELWRKEVATDAAPEKMATVAFTQKSPEVQTLSESTIQSPVVSSNYTYYISWCWEGTNRNYGVQGFSIRYTES